MRRNLEHSTVKSAKVAGTKNGGTEPHKAILGVSSTLHKPYIQLIKGQYLNFRYLECLVMKSPKELWLHLWIMSWRWFHGCSLFLQSSGRWDFTSWCYKNTLIRRHTRVPDVLQLLISEGHFSPICGVRSPGTVLTPLVPRHQFSPFSMQFLNLHGEDTEMLVCTADNIKDVKDADKTLRPVNLGRSSWVSKWRTSCGSGQFYIVMTFWKSEFLYFSKCQCGG